MDSLILALDAVTHDELSRIGGKAAQSWKLQAAGFPVPPSFCLTMTAFHQALAVHRERISRRLSGADLTDADTAHSVSDEIMSILAHWDIPASVIKALDAALPAIEMSFPLAVRSSATAEDRADVSFAGQYETVLGVRDRNALLAAILACWRSFFTPHALVARAAARALGEDEAITLLLQHLIDVARRGDDPGRGRGEPVKPAQEPPRPRPAAHQPPVVARHQQVVEQPIRSDTGSVARCGAGRVRGGGWPGLQHSGGLAQGGERICSVAARRLRRSQ